MSAQRPGDHRIHVLRILAALLAAVLSVPLLTGTAHAADDWYVSTAGSDGNDCTSPATACRTVAGALAKATAGGTIDVAAGTYPETLVIRSDVTLRGAGAASTVVGPISLWDADVTAELAKLTVSGGQRTAGGGIENHGTLTVRESVIRDNRAWVGEGYQAYGAGVFNQGTLTLIDSTVSGNIANGLTNQPASGLGGGIYNGGTLTVTGSTISGNTAQIGGGLYNLGTLVMTNSTISGNTAKVGGGLHTTDSGLSRLGFVTVANNTGQGQYQGFGSGGGVSGTGRTELTASVVGGNTDATGGAPDCGGTVSSGGANVIGNTTGCTLTGATASDTTGKDPRLGPLADNGGPTQTHGLLEGSPARDAAWESTAQRWTSAGRRGRRESPATAGPWRPRPTEDSPHRRAPATSGATTRAQPCWRTRTPRRSSSV